jgi:nicotinate-nucleotide adenylyltransferase
LKAIKALGILGGTFDPIHYGHIVAAECARDAFKLDRVIFVPAARPPHKEGVEVLDSQERLHMVSAALKDNPHFAVSALEIERPGLSYTIETIEFFQEQYTGVQIYFIMGTDALLLLNTWKEADRLAAMCRFIIVTRPGYHLDRSHAGLQDITPVLWDNLQVLPVPGLHISSSDIRQRVARGQTIKYLLPPVVEEYILQRGLYVKEDEKNDNRRTSQKTD